MQDCLGDTAYRRGREGFSHSERLIPTIERFGVPRRIRATPCVKAVLRPATPNLRLGLTHPMGVLLRCGVALLRIPFRVTAHRRGRDSFERSERLIPRRVFTKSPIFRSNFAAFSTNFGDFYRPTANFRGCAYSTSRRLSSTAILAPFGLHRCKSRRRCAWS